MVPSVESTKASPAALMAWVCVTAAVEFSVVLPDVVKPSVFTVFTVSMAKAALLVRLTVPVLPASFLTSLPVFVRA